MPLLYHNKTFTSGHLTQLPTFEYKATDHGNNGLRIWGVLALTVLVLAITVLRYKLRAGKEELLL